MEFRGGEGRGRVWCDVVKWSVAVWREGECSGV